MARPATKTFKCEECSVQFPSEEKLRQHNIQRHHYYCATCKHSLGDKHALRSHNNSLVHEPRQWACPLCSTKKKKRGKFKTPSALTQHLESGIHAGVTRYHIIAATQALQTPAPVALHATPGIYSAPAPMKVIGGVATKASSWTGTAFQCDKCEKAFRTLSALNQHLASAVHDELEMICPGCTTEFALTSALVRHLESGVCGTASYASVQANARALIDTVSGLLKG
ncbi:hypothetical protein K523DRAFT_298513 [Schizophyllum commune Tattone D]|nr:hypothetical protein K523DRAFT_298513 [Schizophyllum commune Tattone D]